MGPVSPVAARPGTTMHTSHTHCVPVPTLNSLHARCFVPFAVLHIFGSKLFLIPRHPGYEPVPSVTPPSGSRRHLGTDGAIRHAEVSGVQRVPLTPATVCLRPRAVVPSSPGGRGRTRMRVHKHELIYWCGVVVTIADSSNGALVRCMF